MCKLNNAHEYTDIFPIKFNLLTMHYIFLMILQTLTLAMFKDRGVFSFSVIDLSELPRT